jgi:hypothetical protein
MSIIITLRNGYERQFNFADSVQGQLFLDTVLAYAYNIGLYTLVIIQ